VKSSTECRKKAVDSKKAMETRVRDLETRYVPGARPVHLIITMIK